MGPLNSKNMSHPIEIVKSFYAALDRGDISSALATLHDELEWAEAERALITLVLGIHQKTFMTNCSSRFCVIGKDS